MDLAATATGDRVTRMSLSAETVAGRLEQLSNVGRNYLTLSGLNDHATTGSGPTRQSVARDSEPLHLSVAGARAW